MKKIIYKIKIEAKKYFRGASGCHDWTHVERVRVLALNIGRKENADLDVLEIAAYLHDIGRKKEMRNKGKFCHAEEGARLAKKILKKYNIDKKTINNILHCIISHRYRNNHVPKTIEAKILYDADKLDSIGAVGIARDFLFAGFIKHDKLYTGREKELAKTNKNFLYTKEDTAILEYEFKLKKIKNNIITREGKRIAQERDRYMKDFFKRFWLEVNGHL